MVLFGQAARRIGGVTPRVITVSEGLQEHHQIGNLVFAQAWRFARMAVVRHFAGIDVFVELGRQIVELLRSTIRIERIKLLRIGIATHVKTNRIGQGLETAIVEKHLARGDIAQGRHLERAAQIGVVGQIGAERATQTQVVISRIGIRRDRGITRQTEIVVGVVGEYR